MRTKIQNIPSELKQVDQWVCWVGNDKIPKNPYTGYNAKSNDKSTWSDFKTAVKACKRFNFDGLGFMFANGYFGVDLDHCLDNIDFCDEFVETLQSYAEISKSGSGLHIICKGELPTGSRRKNNVEMYSSGRYFICTGDLYNNQYKHVVDCTESIKVLHSKYLPTDTPSVSNVIVQDIQLDDHEVIDKARNCKTGLVFNMLYSGVWQGVYTSQSEADLALCNHLAFWTGKNESQMDRIFRSSGLYRQKWDEKRGHNTYGAITIAKACANTLDVYQPRMGQDDTSLALQLFGNGQMGSEITTKEYDMTDTGNAHRLFDRYGSILHYSYNRRKWYFWDGMMWRIDEGAEIKKLADDICDDIKKEAFMATDEKTMADKLKWATRTSNNRGKESMIKECQHLETIPASVDDFDKYPDYLNCQNGIINLRNGELLSHDPNFMQSKICYSEYDDSGAQPKRWLQFLREITNDNDELIEYIQRCVGYSLSGSNREQCAYFLYGMGNNGKSTFVETIADLLGGYSANVQPESIMMKKWSGEGANSDIARLKSARFVTSEEPTEGVRLNEGLLKQLTGGSKVTCRFLYSEEFEYEPEFKIWVATNHKPVIRGNDFGIWRRIKLIPFEVNIPKDKVDKNLKYKLRKEFPQILKWAVDGCIKWQKYGIEDPQCVRDAVEEYKAEMDLLASFIDQCIKIDYMSDERFIASDLFKLYSRWARENNEYEMNSRRFGREMTKKMPKKGKSGKGIYYTNIALTEYAEDLLEGNGYRQYSFKDYE